MEEKYIQYLKKRKTIKTFTKDEIPEEVINNALEIAHKAPSSVNNRSGKILDLTKYPLNEFVYGRRRDVNCPH